MATKSKVPSKVHINLSLPSDRVVVAAERVLASGPESPEFRKDSWLIAQALTALSSDLDGLVAELDKIANQRDSRRRTSEKPNMILELRSYAISGLLRAKLARVMTAHGRPMPRRWKEPQ